MNSITLIDGTKVEISESFYVSKKSYNKYLSWEKKLPKKYRKFNPTWSFSHNGIAYNTFVTLGDKKLDVSDYESW